MKVFDHRPTDMRPKHSLSMYLPNDAPTWMTGIVILAAIVMGTFMLELGQRVCVAVRARERPAW